MDTKGGRFSMSIGNVTYAGRGAAKISPSTVTPKAEANADGSAYRTVAAKLASLDLSFDRGIGLKWDAAMLLQSVDVTFVETDAGLTHLYTSASWDGDPTIDTATGEVSGLKIQTDKYQSYKS